MTLRTAWVRLWAKAPRTLRFTRSGKAIIGIALATGFAAINTGNNLLFLGWGLVLSSIVLSGILSEATLRIVDVDLGTVDLVRAMEPTVLAVRMRNGSRRFPAFGLEASITIVGSGGAQRCQVPYQLRLDAGTEWTASTRMTFCVRGRHTVQEVEVSTAYPFGFFHKTRRIDLRRPREFWIAPARVDVSNLSLHLQRSAGRQSERRTGLGDEFFALRPYREGDDLARVHWRRSARTGRWVVMEQEAFRGRVFALELWVGHASNGDPSAEYGLSVLGSLAESLLGKGCGVSVRGPGLSLPRQSGSGAAKEVLRILARVDVGEAMGAPVRTSGATRVALSAGGVPTGTPEIVLDLTQDAQLQQYNRGIVRAVG